MASSNPAPTDTITSTTPAGAADMMMPITITHLVLIAIAIVVTLLMIVRGQRLRRKRQEASDTLEARGASVPVDDGVLEEAPAAPAAQKVAADVAPPAAPIAPAMPPVAPAPPPIADVAPATPPAAPIASATPESTIGDLTTLKGLGPRAAAMLVERGIPDIAALAALTPDQAAAIDTELGPLAGRMARDRWHEQARLLNDGARNQYEAMFGKIG